MKLYIWEDLGGLTESWHDGGGVAVVAETLDEAKALIPRYGDYKDKDTDIGEPTAVYELKGDHNRKVHVFPNAGCC